MEKDRFKLENVRVEEGVNFYRHNVNERYLHSQFEAFSDFVLIHVLSVFKDERQEGKYCNDCRAFAAIQLCCCVTGVCETYGIPVRESSQ